MDFFLDLSKIGCKVFSTEVTELIAALKAINFAVDVGFCNFLLEGDNLGVMNVIQSK